MSFTLYFKHSSFKQMYRGEIGAASSLTKNSPFAMT